MTKWIRLLCGLALLGAVACGLSGPAPTPTPAPIPTPQLAPGTPFIDLYIDNVGFISSAEIEVGTTVIWTNRTGTRARLKHTPTIWGVESVFDSGNMDRDYTFRYTFTEPGVYNYIDSVHAITGKGTITVVEST